MRIRQVMSVVLCWVSWAMASAAVLPPSNAALLSIQTWQTHNGAAVYFVPVFQLPMVDVQVAFAAGSAQDGATPGLAALTNGMLEQGTQALNAQQIAERIATLGARFRLETDRDMAVISLRSLADQNYLAPAVDLIHKMLVHPSFPLRDYKREQAAMLRALQAQQQSPGELAENAFYAALYAKQGYGHPVLGTSASVKRLRREQSQAFYQQYYVAKNAVLTIVGALSRQQAEQLAEDMLAGLPSGVKAERGAAAVLPLSAQRAVHIAYPSSQTHVYLGTLGITPTDPDYFALYVGNHILGGSGLNSRLFKRVRNERGLSYTVYSYFLTLGNRGPFLLNLQTRNQQTEQAILLAKSVLRQFIQQGPSASELASAKQQIIGSLPLSIANNAGISQRLLKIAFYQLPLDYLDSVVAQVQALTVEQVRQAMQARLGQQPLLLVTVGQDATVSEHASP